MSDVRAELAVLARDIGTQATGTYAIFRATTDNGFVMMQHLSETRQPRRIATHADEAEVVRRLDQLVRPAGEHRPLLLELRVGAAGWFEFSYSFDLNSLSPSLVFDNAYRYPAHLATTSQGKPPRGSRAPTEPSVLAEVSLLIRQFLEAYAAIAGEAPDLGSGHTEEEILAAEDRMGLRLPDDMRAVYRNIYGDVDRGLFGWFTPIPLESVVETYLGGRFRTTVDVDDLFDMEPVVFETQPAGTVRRVSRSDSWVTIADDFALNNWAVDLAPGPLGTSGQVLEYGRDTIGPIRYIADSVLTVLRGVVRSLRTQDGWDGEGGRLAPPETLAFTQIPPKYERWIQAGDNDLAGTVAGLDEPTAVQQIIVHGGSSLDLRALAGLHNLRAVRIHRAEHVRLDLAPAQPIELVTVAAKSFDLAPLAGHPTLWHLTLDGHTTPTEVGPLASAPALAYLDLAGAEVTDLEVLRDFPSLRVLTLNDGQWQRLRAHDAVPDGLAAGRLGGRPSVAQGVDWIDRVARRLQPRIPAGRSDVIRGQWT